MSLDCLQYLQGDSMSGIDMCIKEIVNIPATLTSIAARCLQAHVLLVLSYDGERMVQVPHLYVLIVLGLTFPFKGCHSRNELDIVIWYTDVYGLRSVSEYFALREQ